MEDVVKAFEGAGPLHGKEVRDLLDEAKEAIIAARVAADGAGINGCGRASRGGLDGKLKVAFAEVTALRAASDAGGGFLECFHQSLQAFRLFGQQMDGQAVGGAGSQTRQFAQDVLQIIESDGHGLGLLREGAGRGFFRKN